MSTALVGALRVVLGMDSAAFEKGADAAERRLNAFAKRMDKIGQGISNAGSTMSTYVTLPLLGLGAAAIKAGKETEEATAAVKQALTSMGDGAGYSFEQLSDMASALQKVTTFDDDDIMAKVTANLLTFGKVQGKVFERAQVAALNLSARLGQDLQTSAIQLGKALNDPVKGVTALTRVGVSFTAEQKEQIKAMVEAGDTAKAQALILGELEKQYGGQAEALAKTDPGRMTQAWNQIGEVMETVGQIILPILADLSVYVKDAAEWFNALDPSVQKTAVAIAAFAAAAGPVLVVVGTMVSSFAALAPLLPVIGAAFTAMLGPIGLVTAAIGLAVAAWANWDTIKASAPQIAAAVEAALTVIKTGLDGFITHMQLTMQLLKQVFSGDLSAAFATLQQILSNLLSTLGQQLETVWPGIIENVKARIAELVKAFVDLKDQAIAAVVAMVTAIQDYMTQKLNAVFDAVNAKIEAVKQTFLDLYDAVVGHSYVPDMVSEIGEWMGKLDHNMVGKAETATGEVKGSFEKMGEGIGGIFDGLGTSIAGLIKGTTSVKQVVGGLLQSLSQSLFNSIDFGGVFGKGGGFFKSLLGGLIGFADGGSFKVGGAGGIDSQVVAFRASPNETVSINHPGQDIGGGMHVTVGVSADSAGNLTPFVESVSRRIADRTTRGAIGMYDKQAQATMGQRMALAQANQL